MCGCVYVYVCVCDCVFVCKCVLGCQAPTGDDSVAMLWDLARCCLALPLLSTWAAGEAGAQHVTQLLQGSRLLLSLVTLTRGDPRGHDFTRNTLSQVPMPVCMCGRASVLVCGRASVLVCLCV